METKKLYEIIGQSGHFYSDQFGYIKNDVRINALNISMDCSIYRMVKTQAYCNGRYDYIEQEERSDCSLRLTSIYKHVADSGYDRIDPKDFLDDKIETFYANVWDLHSRQERVNSKNPFKIEFKSFFINGIPVSDMDGFRIVLESLVYVLPEKYAEEPLYDYEAKVGDYVASMKPNRGTARRQTVLVKKVYRQPNENNLLCKLYSEYDGEEFYATCGGSFLWKLPYKEYPDRVNELEQFKDEIRENELRPLLEMADDKKTGNVYWRKIDEAATYTVSLYKYHCNKDVEKKLYLLEEFEVDRNKGWLTIDNLCGDNYIIQVKAENRSGGILAVSRGIKIKWTGMSSEQVPNNKWNN